MERREAPRSRLIKGAEIKFGDVSLNCAAFDLSLTGARMRLLSPSEVPESVTLRLPDGTTRAARRRWHRDDEVGFEFLAQERLRLVE
jgi:hypothetical protein